MSTLSFEGLDINDVFVALRARAVVKNSGWTNLYERSRPFFSQNEIDAYIRDSSGKLTYVDRIDGGAVVMKIHFGTFPHLDSSNYNRPADNGPGAMESVLEYLLQCKKT